MHSHSNACLYCVDSIQAKKSAYFLCVFMRARRCDPPLGSEKKRFHIQALKVYQVILKSLFVVVVVFLLGAIVKTP